MHNKMLRELLGVNHRIIQAPMAGGITTPELVAQVSENGGLGMIAGGGLPSEKVKEAIRRTRKLTSKNFGVNLFVPMNFEVTETQVQKAYERLRPVHDEFGLKQEDIIPPRYGEAVHKFNDQIETVIEAGVPVCSFIFGLPADAQMERLKEAGIITIATATTAEEAVAIESAGVDIVVVQGFEAGGHRGAFLKDSEDSQVGLMSLLPETVSRVNIPVVAAGGIMHGRNIAAALVLGAAGVQMGTAFLSVKESGAHNLHKNVLRESLNVPAVLTKLFTGRQARAVKNKFISEFKAFEEEMVAYPVQRSLTQAFQDASKEAGRIDYAMLLAGQGKYFARDLSARQLIEALAAETSELGYEI